MKMSSGKFKKNHGYVYATIVSGTLKALFVNHLVQHIRIAINALNN